MRKYHRTTEGLQVFLSMVDLHQIRGVTTVFLGLVISHQQSTQSVPLVH